MLVSSGCNRKDSDRTLSKVSSYLNNEVLQPVEFLSSEAVKKKSTEHSIKNNVGIIDFTVGQ